MSSLSLILGAAATGGALALLAVITAIMIKVLQVRRLREAKKEVAKESWKDENKQTNYILCSDRKVYTSTDELSVEEVLAHDIRSAKTVRALWMKRAPTQHGSEVIMEVFNGQSPKPVLHVGVVYEYGAGDREGLKDLVRNGFRIKPWEDISQRVRPTRYRNSLPSYLGALHVTDTPVYTDREASVIACGEDGVNHILTDTGVLYRSMVAMETGGKNVFEVLSDNFHASNGLIKQLWVKKAPVYNESEMLKCLFQSSTLKPTLYIGHIHKYKAADRQGLKNLIKDGFQLRVWEDVSQCVKPYYDDCLKKYLEYLIQETSEYPNTEPVNYTESTVAVISSGEDRVTHLLTNEGVMYRNRYQPYTHAEEILTTSGEVLPSNITEMWIKNSPCARCTGILIDFFRDTPNKPVIYVGSIYNPNDKENRNGLLNLVRDGFKIRVWGTMNANLYGERNEESEHYLRGLEREVARERERGQYH